MENPFTQITTEDALEHLIIRSKQAPVILFKHDPYCGISSTAYHEMRQLPDPVVMVDVANHHDFSQAIAAKTGVKHESPQVIILWDGQGAWSASHYKITRQSVSQALQQFPTGE